jgi:type I restriction enzyme S subunit
MSDWQVVPFVRCMVSQVDYRGATPRKTDSGVQLVTARNVRQGWIDYESSREFVDPVEYATIMRRGTPVRGDLLLTMEAPLGNVALIDREDIALAQRIIKFRVDTRIALPEFIVFAVQSIGFQNQLMTRATGSTALGLKASKLPELRLALPPLAEQRVIVEFLSRENARVDILIGEQHRLIDMLRERRDAQWASDFDRLTGRAPLIQIRRLIDSIVDGPFGSSLTSRHYVDNGARVIRLGNIGINEFRNDDAAYISLDYAAELTSHAVVPGDVVVAGLGDEKMPLGRAAVVPDIGPAIVKADCYRVRPKAAVLPAYLAWALSAPPTRNQISLLARGATRARLNTSVVREVRIPVPLASEQREIVERSGQQLFKIDTLIAETERFIELARERRAGLITAAVTGQVDVRGEVA